MPRGTHPIRAPTMPDEPSIPDTTAMHERKVRDLEATISAERAEKERLAGELLKLQEKPQPKGDPALFDLDEMPWED